MGPIFNPEVKIAPEIEETQILVPSEFWEFANFLVNNPSLKGITSTVIERATDSAERIVRRDLGPNNFNQALKPSFAPLKSRKSKRRISFITDE